MEAIGFVVIGVVGIGLLWVLGPDKLRARPSDLPAIKAAYEGLQGNAGPSMTVVSIIERGMRPAFGRFAPPARLYDVILRNVDGQQHRRRVAVTAGLLSNGQIEEIQD